MKGVILAGELYHFTSKGTCIRYKLAKRTIDLVELPTEIILLS